MSTKIVNIVNIAGLNKVKLLRNLWNRQIVAGFFAMNPSLAPAFDEDLETKAVKYYIDYFCGRAIKCDLSGDEVNPSSYNRDAGPGAFQEVVNSMRSGAETVDLADKTDTGVSAEEMEKIAASMIIIIKH